MLNFIINDENSNFHRQLKIWNFQVNRTVYHVGKSTEAIISFVCRPGFRITKWGDLHLRTHVHVRSDGTLNFHEKMRECGFHPIFSESKKSFSIQFLK
ncbi:hypothetical protein MHBO_005077 [Bonamia ostreae]|uniref:Uncharacterized protein n=1 Tax=Bonamia ostreae TaxID=126728 RepID=A0ABV2AV16_9EUKA